MVSLTVLEAHYLFPSILSTRSQPSPFSQSFSHFLSNFSPLERRFRPKLSKFLVHGARFGSAHAGLPETQDEIETKDVDWNLKRRTGGRVSSSRSVNKRKENRFAETKFRTNGKDKQSAERKSGNDKKQGKNHESFQSKVKDEEYAVINGETKKNQEIKGQIGKWETAFRAKLDMCSRRGDVMGAIELYDKAQREGIKLNQYHYTVILYLCASAAAGVVCYAKSGRGARVLNFVSGSGGVSRERKVMKDENKNSKAGLGFSADKEEDVSSELNDSMECKEKNEILVSEETKQYALKRGLEIYAKLCDDNIPMNEASLTSVARMAAAMGDGDLAFEMVKQMKPLGINPRLRSYAPALSTFCNGGEVEKALMVEKHMSDNGLYPEEPELEALLRVCVEYGKGDKVYYLLHKLRTAVRSVSPYTEGVIRKWFESISASRVGKRKWNPNDIKEAMKNGGGGWHGHGWLGTGKWVVSDTAISADGFCNCCGEKLELIDLDPVETENFAQSVALLARKREKNSNFHRFQKWLDYYGPYEAVIDAANVGLFSQKRFMPSKVNAVVNGIRQMLPSRKWPLIVLHSRRITGTKNGKLSNKSLFEKWQIADALYPTPIGSNDDWYWLYAAIKFGGLIITNDKMRDHTFQLLGSDFFPKWKERHQVRFSFSEAGPVFHMPPPYSITIQESEKGHWHIPIAVSEDHEEDRRWLCIVRRNSLVSDQLSPISPGDFQEGSRKNGCTARNEADELKISQQISGQNAENGMAHTRELYQSLRNIVSGSDMLSDNYTSILPKLEAAEKLAGCVIDFEI